MIVLNKKNEVPKVIVEKMKDWGRRAYAYFDPFKNEIHVLDKDDLTAFFLFHERMHWKDWQTKWKRPFMLMTTGYGMFILIFVLCLYSVLITFFKSPFINLLLIPCFLITSSMFYFEFYHNAKCWRIMQKEKKGE